MVWTQNYYEETLVPGHYSREVHQKLMRLTQGTKGVEDYYQEMEILMVKAAEDSHEATMAWFLACLNREVQDRLGLQEYVDIYEFLHKEILNEKQMKRKPNPKSSYGNTTRPSYGKEDKVFVKPKEEPKASGQGDQGKAPATRNKYVKCFKCHGFGHYASECTNMKVMIFLESGELISEDEKDEKDEVSEEEVVDYQVCGELLGTRRSLKFQSKPEEHDQRENLFHTRCIAYD